jgi:hypothetical protein
MPCRDILYPYLGLLKEKSMPRMTEEEGEALDELLTRTTPKLGPNGTGFFARNRDYA